MQWSTQQLGEFLAAVSSKETEASAALAAVEGAAEALDAEVAAIVCDGALVAAVGYPEEATPVAELESVCAGGSQLEVPGVGACPAVTVALEHPPGAVLIVARSSPGRLDRAEEAMLRGMARATSMTLRILRLLEVERAGRERLERLAREQDALRRIATLVAEEAPADDVFAAVAEQAARLLGATSGNVSKFIRDDRPARHAVVAGWSLGGTHIPVGSELELAGNSLAGLVLSSGRAARFDGIAGYAGPAIEIARRLGIESAVAVPIVVERGMWGVLAVSSNQASPLPSETEQRLSRFGELIATAISNTEARTELRRMAEQQAALRRVATLVARGASPPETFAAVAEEVAQLLGSDVVSIRRFEPDATATLIAGVGEHSPLGSSIAIEPPLAIEHVFRSGCSARVDHYDEISRHEIGILRREGIRSSVASPIVVGGRLWGTVVTSSRGGALPEDAEQRLVDFTELVATAIANAQNRAELTASRARIVAAGDDARRRIERDLHDGIQQGLVNLMLETRSALELLPDGSSEIAGKLSGAVDGLRDLLDQLRELSRGIHPAILTQGGLHPALASLVRRSPLRVELHVPPLDRLPEPVERAAYYAVSEALTNAAKHSGASVVHVDIDLDDAAVRLSVRDDGIGGADPARGSGLVGLVDRVEALGGTIDLSSPPRRGTTIVLELPVDPSAPSRGHDAAPVGA